MAQTARRPWQTPRPDELKDAELDIIADIAGLYYADQVTQEELSHKFGMSRAKIGRLLKRAREEGIVEITVRPHPGVADKIEQVRAQLRAGKARIFFDEETETCTLVLVRRGERQPLE